MLFKLCRSEAPLYPRRMEGIPAGSLVGTRFRRICRLWRNGSWHLNGGCVLPQASYLLLELLQSLRTGDCTGTGLRAYQLLLCRMLLWEEDQFIPRSRFPAGISFAGRCVSDPNAVDFFRGSVGIFSTSQFASFFTLKIGIFLLPRAKLQTTAV